MQPNKSVDEQIVDAYTSIVRAKYPDLLAGWPVISGHDVVAAVYRGWTIIVLKHTGNRVMKSTNGLGELASGVVGTDAIRPANKRQVRERLTRHFRLTRHDAVFLFDQSGDIGADLEHALLQHEIEMGLCPMKIFLSHKGADKPLVREFKQTLAYLGFDPWLDEDAMTAGTELERGILQGFKDSCAAVFFVTPNFADEQFIATEINYAIQEKRAKQDRFAIITLVLSDGPKKGVVPELLKQYVWKEPTSEVEALRELVRALPLRVGSPTWK
jgi:hypothetical protein